MSKRAEEAALKAYPKEIKVAYGPLSGADGPCEFDDNLPFRMGYQEGYEQAEKDLALTWEDMSKIDAIILNLYNEFSVDYSIEINRQKFYEEVLKRFNEQRQK